ncbi:MAG: PLDc N-terminal domain-containing protein [Pyrinomonadaceae bacterium]
MNKFTSAIAFCVMMLVVPGITLAQRRNDGDPAAGCAACGFGFVVIIVAIIAVIALNIALLVWVARDAKARGLDSSILWMVLVLFTGLLGLIIYIFSRPQGDLGVCPHCGNKRLQSSAKCPTCGNH